MTKRVSVTCTFLAIIFPAPARHQTFRRSKKSALASTDLELLDWRRASLHHVIYHVIMTAMFRALPRIRTQWSTRVPNMSERLLALASGVHDGNPPEITPADMVRVASDAGYNSVGLWVAPGDNWHRNTAGEVAAALQETGLVAIDVEVIWLQPGGKPDPLHHQIIALGGEVGAKNCLIVSSEPDREVTKHFTKTCASMRSALG